MPPSREDITLILQIEQALKPSKPAKKFVWSDAVAGDTAGTAFFDTYGWDSDERMHINEVATYYEMYGMVWKYGFVDEEFLFDWVPASMYWQRIGAILIAARTLLDEQELWVNFEALAGAQGTADTGSPMTR